MSFTIHKELCASKKQELMESHGRRHVSFDGLMALRSSSNLLLGILAFVSAGKLVENEIIFVRKLFRFHLFSQIITKNVEFVRVNNEVFCDRVNIATTNQKSKLSVRIL